MRKLLAIVFLFITTICVAQQPEFKLFLVGDAGEDELPGEVLDSLHSKLVANPNSAVVFMGDNSYKDRMGFIPSFRGFDSSKVTRGHILSQLAIVNNYKGSVYFVPGNHDWWNAANFKRGKHGLKMEESFVEVNLKKNKTIANPDSTFLPRDGMPGPTSVVLDNNRVRIVCIDTYWLISLGFRHVPAERLAIEAKFYHDLDSTLAYATSHNQTVFVVAHHPVYSDGLKKAGPWKHPYFIMRYKQNRKDFPSYKAMIDKLTPMFEKYPGVYFCSGHLHAMQYHVINNVHYIISGAGSKLHNMSGPEATKPCEMDNCNLWNEKGFFEVDVYSKAHQEVIMYHDDGKKSCDLSQPGGCK